MLVDLFDLYQAGQIKNANRRIELESSTAEHRHRSARDEIDLLHARLDRLTLINEAMWQLLAETTGLTMAHLEHRVYAVDMQDGNHDGRRQPQPSDCTSCGAKIHPTANICTYCSAQAPQRSIFDMLDPSHGLIHPRPDPPTA